MAKTVALVTYGENDSTQNILQDGNFKPLADALTGSGFIVEAIFYNNSKYEQLRTDMVKYDAVQVWVNPVSGGNDRFLLDALLSELSQKGVYVSAHPDVILKIGTKKVLYTTKDMAWGGDIELYPTTEDFEARFLASMDNASIRVLKQYRGQSGDGVFKVRLTDNGNVSVIPATSPAEERIYTKDEFYKYFNRYFENGGLFINQQWAESIINGMVRAYVTGNKVSGFGYQESVALCPLTYNEKVRTGGGRFYYSEHCGLFQDLRNILETKWIPQLQEIHSITDEMLPLLWDIDFFINDINGQCPEMKYTLCEINVSCVSPFPPSCASYMARALKAKLYCRVIRCYVDFPFDCQ